jgi:hypothetical protein
MTRRMLCAVAIAAAVTAVATGVAGAVTPANGGDAGGTLVTINNGPGDQTDPHVSGDLAVYTNSTGATSTIHYFDFATGSDSVVPNAGEFDLLSDVNGGRIVFSRVRSDGTTAVVLFDTVSGVQTDLDPQPGSSRFGARIGGDTVAYEELNVGNGDIFAYDLATGTATNLTQSPDVDQNDAVSSSGDVVVWERCVGSNCDILQSVRSGGAWGAPTAVAATTSNEGNPDTDGTTVVYDSDRPSATDQDIYSRPVAGGPETQLSLPGIQFDPSISNGVVAFESRETAIGSADIYVYVIATNTLFRVTDTPAVDESLNDVSVLPNGDVRVVWAANDDLVAGNHNIYGRTFSLPATGVFTAAVQQPINANGSSVFKAGKGVVPSSSRWPWTATRPARCRRRQSRSRASRARSPAPSTNPSSSCRPTRTRASGSTVASTSTTSA